MGNLKAFLAKYIYPACGLYAAITIALALFATYSYNQGYAPSLKTLVCVFLFSFFINIINKIFSMKKYSLALRLLLHFVATATLFFVLFFVILGSYESGYGALYIIIAYALVYALVSAIILTIRHLMIKEETKDIRYTSQFKK